MNAIRNFDEHPKAGTFIVRRSGRSDWFVSSPDRRTGGVFRSMDDAWHFARSEARSHRHGEVIVLGDSALDIESYRDARKTKSVHFDGTVVEANAERQS